MNQLQTMETEVGQRTLFDYGALDAETRIVVQQRTSEIKGIVKHVASELVEVGGKLAEVKERLKNGARFKNWLDAEFPRWSERTAHNLIYAWKEYHDADFAIDGIAPSALYLLSAPSTPKAAREMAKQIVEQGEEVSHSTAKEVVRQAKARKPKQVELIEEPEGEEADVDGGEEDPPPVEVYVERSELDEMDRVNACQKIDAGGPVEFYDHEGEPIIIVGSVSSGAEGMISAEGWRIVPENDAKGVTPPERGEFETRSYIGTRVNVGTKSRPNWWVIVGPEYEFKRKPAEAERALKGAEAAEVRTCRVCGCTDADCRDCLVRAGEPCYWVAEDLCSACAPADQKLPDGWVWAEGDSYDPGFNRAANLARNLRTLAFPTPAEAIRAAHEMEAAAVLGLAGAPKTAKGAAEPPPASSASPAPVSAQKQAIVESPAALDRHPEWLKARVEIVITLMPGAEPRKIMHNVRAVGASEEDDEVVPLVAISSGEAELLEALPPITRGLFERAAVAFAARQVSMSAKKPVKKQKPAAKKPAAKSKTKAKGGKK